MTNEDVATHTPVLAIAPSTRGFGFALLEERETLADWGLKIVTGDKNTACLRRLKDLVGQYKPEALVLQDVFAKDSKRRIRIKILVQEILDFTAVSGPNAALFSTARVQKILFGSPGRTKDDVAAFLAARFPNELRTHLPKKRKAWTSQDSRMAIFDAVALGLAFQLRTQKYSPRTPGC